MMVPAYIQVYIACFIFIDTHVNVDWEGSGSGLAEKFISHLTPVSDVFMKFMRDSNFSLASFSSQRFIASLIASATDSGTHTMYTHTQTHTGINHYITKSLDMCECKSSTIYQSWELRSGYYCIQAIASSTSQLYMYNSFQVHVLLLNRKAYDRFGDEAIKYMFCIVKIVCNCV